MLISIVIPTYNRRDSVVHCVESLSHQTLSPELFEIIVVIDGSTDGSIESLSALKLSCTSHYIEQKNLGQAAARNAGIQAAKGQYILFLDDDFLCESHLLEEHLVKHTSQDIVVVGPISRDRHDHSLPAFAIDREIRPFYDGLGPGLHPLTWLPPNSSLPRASLLAVGGYDESFSSAREDTELGLRLAERGMQIVYAPNATVRQRYLKSASELVSGAALFGYNDVRLLRMRPNYLPHCNLSRLDHGPWWKRSLRNLIAILPISPEPLLAVAYWFVEKAKEIGFLREAGIRLLNLRRYIVWLRAAVRQAGSFPNLLALVEDTRLRTHR